MDDDEKGKLFLDELDEIKYPLPLEKAISSILINNAENTFFSPALWNTFGKAGQKQLCKELEAVIKIIPTKFVHSKLNLFDKKFAASKLAS